MAFHFYIGFFLLLNITSITRHYHKQSQLTVSIREVLSYIPCSKTDHKSPKSSSHAIDFKGCKGVLAGVLHMVSGSPSLHEWISTFPPSTILSHWSWLAMSLIYTGKFLVEKQQQQQQPVWKIPTILDSFKKSLYCSAYHMIKLLSIVIFIKDCCCANLKRMLLLNEDLLHYPIEADWSGKLFRSMESNQVALRCFVVFWSPMRLLWLFHFPLLQIICNVVASFNLNIMENFIEWHDRIIWYWYG